MENVRIEKKSDHVYAVVLAGGRGSRLPIAGSTPKQFAVKFNGTTFIQDIDRMISKAIKPSKNFTVVTNDEQADYAAKQLTSLGIPTTNIINKHPKYGYVAVMAKAAHEVRRIDEEAILFISPSDQHVIGEEEFAEDIRITTEYAKRGKAVLLGVKVSDANIVGGCGNAVYDSSQDGPFYKIDKFIEKPLENPKNATPEERMENVKKLLLADNSVVNTGFYALPAKMLCDAYPEDELDRMLEELEVEHPDQDDLRLNPEEMMKKLNTELYVGHFRWADCGTLAAYFGIQKRTPNHGNASIGEISRFNCRDSLFVSSTEGLHMYASNIRNGLACIAFASKTGGIDVAVINMDRSQDVRYVTDFFEKGERASYSYDSENCMVMPSNISESCKVAFLAVKNIFVYVNRLENGDINVNISANGECICDKKSN